MAEIDGYIGGFVHDRCIIDGSEIEQIWRNGEKIFDSSISLPTDYILAYSFNNTLNALAPAAITASVTAGTAMWEGDAFKFNGENGVRANSAVFINSNKLSISADIYIDSISNIGRRCIIDSSVNTFGNNGGFGIYIDENQITLIDSASGIAKSSVTFNVSDGWNNIKFLLNRDLPGVQRIIAYLNGQKITTTPVLTNNNATSNYTTARINFGYVVSPVGSFFTGKIKNFKLYNRLLTDAEASILTN